LRNPEIFALALVAISGGLYLAFLAQRPGPYVSDAPSSKRFRNAVHIGNAIRHYGEDHGEALPRQLSELVPTYVPVSNLNWFFWPPIVAAKAADPLTQVVRRLDTEGAFIYLGTNGYKVGLIMYEPPDLWEFDGNRTTVTALRTNFLATILPAGEVQQRLRLIQ